MKKFIGLRNCVTSKKEWKYLMLYEIDGHDYGKYLAIISLYKRFETSFISYKTKNGFHFVGLSPISAHTWGYWFQKLQNMVPEYYSGQTLRLSLKENENQDLIYFSLRYPYLERLARVYFKRFSIPKEDISIYSNPPKYSCMFEKYWSAKI